MQKKMVFILAAVIAVVAIAAIVFGHMNNAGNSVVVPQLSQQECMNMITSDPTVHHDKEWQDKEAACEKKMWGNLGKAMP